MDKVIIVQDSRRKDNYSEQYRVVSESLEKEVIEWYLKACKEIGCWTFAISELELGIKYEASSNESVWIMKVLLVENI